MKSIIEITQKGEYYKRNGRDNNDHHLFGIRNEEEKKRSIGQCVVFIKYLRECVSRKR